MQAPAIEVEQKQLRSHRSQVPNRMKQQHPQKPYALRPSAPFPTKMRAIEPLNFDRSTYDWFRLLALHWPNLLRVTTWRTLLSSFRGLINFFIAFFSFYIGGKISWPVSLAAASAIGMLSATIQFNVSAYSEWLANSRSKLTKALKWYSVEILFLGVPSTILFLANRWGNDWLSPTKELFVAALFSLISQGIWEIGIADVEKAYLFHSPFTEKSRIRLRTAIKCSIISMISVLAATLKLSTEFWGTALFCMISISGAVYYCTFSIRKRLLWISLLRDVQQVRAK